MHEKQKSKLESIIDYLDRYKDLMIKATDAVIDQEISDYPIFVIHDGSMNLGVSILQDEELAISISSLEEFSTKQLISDDRIKPFIKIYKDPFHYFCLLVTLLEKPSFVFAPRKKNDPAVSN